MKPARFTKFWEGQGQRLLDALLETLRHPEVHPRWQDLLEILTRANAEDVEKVLVALRTLVVRVRRFGPQLDHALNTPTEDGLSPFLLERALAVLGVRDHRFWRPRFAGLLPDNPIRRRADGTWTGLEQARREHHLEIASVLGSQRPAGQRGRPRKIDVGGPAKIATRPPDPEQLTLALQAYRLKCDRVPWHIIAARLRLPGADRSERTRGRVRRLVALGARLSRKKIVLT